MKYLQVVVLKNISVLALIFLSMASYAQSAEMTKADSLFKAKQYTQSLEIYQNLFRDKEYSSAMLLRMAYINEGLGKKGLTLYYLKLYHLATHDDQALVKSEELAAKYKLSGFEIRNGGWFMEWFKRNIIIAEILMLLALFSAVAVIVFQKKEQKPWGAFVGAMALIVALVYCNNFYHSSFEVIISSDQAYLMNGPSAGAKVTAIIPEGNLLKCVGKEDVWQKVIWLDQIVYVKENTVVPIELSE